MDPAPFAQRRVGTTLRGKWTLERLLGEGGMAAVYVGVHRIGQRAAIKILHPEVARNREICARFEQEAHAVNRFTHPGVVAIRDVDVTEDGAPFLVMELLEGQSVADLASRPGGVEPAEVLRLVGALLDVLVAAHAQGIVHRDIKPDNLFVTRDGSLKVLDFGIARVKDGMKDLHTRAGAMLGTAPYMAPEQIRGADIDARVDVFAVGATMFRLLARRRIHEASSEPELLVKMATMPAPPLLSVAPSVPPEIAGIVDRALAYDRDARYPDAASMLRDVRALVAAPAPALSPAPAPVVSPAPAPVVSPAPAPVVLAAPAVSAFDLTRREGPSPESPATVRVVVPPSLGPEQVASAVSAADPTLLAGAPVPVPAGLAPAVAQQRREETRTAVIFLLGLALLVVISLLVVALLRPSSPADASAAIPSASAADPGDPSPPPDDITRPPRPGFPPWDHHGKGKGKGHGRGKHHERDEDE